MANEAADAEEIGIGGGTYLEMASGEDQIEGIAWPLKAAMLEESFTRPRMLLYTTYQVQRGDIIGDLAMKFGLNEDTLLSANGVTNARLLQIGKVLRVPNQDGIQYKVKNGDTLESIAEKYSSDAASIQQANELFSEVALAGSTLFIPGGKLPWVERQEINGDLFVWPVSSRRITSNYGWRTSPFGTERQFHSGLDIGTPYGTPIRAAMSGRVSAAGWDNVLGNYVIITHHAGYRTLYGHMSKIRVRQGAYVGTNERIGDVGSTGLSTGPHLHFTVFKNGVTINPRTLVR
jgi:murein DD-endopeptidase MepM/ murein hydrolase activator NlpD